MCWHWQELGTAGEEEITLITPSHQGGVLAVHSHRMLLTCGHPCTSSGRISLLALQPWLGWGWISALPCRDHPHRALQTALGPHMIQGALVCPLPATRPARTAATSPLSFASSSTRCWASCCTLWDMELFPIPKSRRVLSVNLRSSRHFFSLSETNPAGTQRRSAPAHPAASQDWEPSSGPG